MPAQWARIDLPDSKAYAMNELILLRHAHALNAATGETDTDRRLSPIGEAESDAAGVWLKAHHAQPLRVLCSPSQRTRATLERVLTQIGYADARFDERIYDATPGTLFDLLDEHRDASQLMLVGHNPGIETLVALLATGQSGDFRGVPPAGLAWFELNGALEPGAGTLKAFWSP